MRKAKPGSNFSVYVPKHERNFLKICRAYQKRTKDGENFSSFLLNIIKDFINQLPRDQHKIFEDCAQEISRTENKKERAFVSKFIKKG